MRAAHKEAHPKTTGVNANILHLYLNNQVFILSPYLSIVIDETY